jgi:RNA polymerase sigma-70 factor (ECF subfamily)
MSFLRSTNRETPPPSPLRDGPLSGWDDAALLHDEQQPAESFAIVYRRHVDAIMRFAAMRAIDATGAADLVSETFMAALSARYKYVAQHETARLWLLGIAANRIRDSYRRRDREQRRVDRLGQEQVALTQADHDGYAALLASADREALDALGDLPLVQQHAIRARIIEERSYADVAEALGLTEPNARKHVSRGLAALRRALKEHQR